MEKVTNRVADSLKNGFFKGVGLGAGLLTTSLFAAAAAMNVFSPGQTISSAQINQNFAIAAPEGAVMAFYLAGCPDGWAPADGTNGTPDLRGQFIRGRDDAGTGPAGNDPAGSRAIGNVQADAFQGHRMFRNTSNVTETHIMISGGGADMQGAGGGLNINFSAVTTGDATTDGTNGTPRIANETRPKNVALTYCMRKNS
ncbi:MAG: tail fiber protein [Leptospirales bacterium]|nr:tail fiber protein [Leptospirales bacterium]